MIRRGLQQVEVARALGLNRRTVQSTLRILRQRGLDLPQGRTNQTWTADDAETRAEARARVARELAEGKRCPRCWLLKPCDDHG